jgi:hypothetical protein
MLYDRSYSPVVEVLVSPRYVQRVMMERSNDGLYQLDTRTKVECTPVPTISTFKVTSPTAGILGLSRVSRPGHHHKTSPAAGGLKEMDGFSLEVKMLQFEYGNEVEWIQRQLSMATLMLCGASASYLEQLVQSSGRTMLMVDQIGSY